MLRPGEACALTREHFLLPHEHGGLDVMIRVRSPKRSRGARREFTRVEAVDTHPWFLCVLSGLRPGSRLWPASQNALVRRLRLSLSYLTPRPGLFTLGSLRAGGATALFSRWHEDVARLQWRGRWRDGRSLPHYVQELIAARITSALRGPELVKIQQVAALIGAVLDQVWTEECCCTQCVGEAWLAA